jgi:hypothetical protein
MEAAKAMGHVSGTSSSCEKGRSHAYWGFVEKKCDVRTLQISHYEYFITILLLAIACSQQSLGQSDLTLHGQR